MFGGTNDRSLARSGPRLILRRWLVVPAEGHGDDGVMCPGFGARTPRLVNFYALSENLERRLAAASDDRSGRIRRLANSNPPQFED